MSSDVIMRTTKTAANELQSQINKYIEWVKSNPPQTDAYLTYASVHTCGNPRHNLEKHIWESLWNISFNERLKYFNKL